MLNVIRPFLILVAVALLAAAWTDSSQAQNVDYQLGSGDRVRISVFNQPDLSGEFEIGSNGTISMPLIGAVPAAGKSLPELEEQIVFQLKQGFLNQPKVTAEVLNYRPFYIQGEVGAPGSYPYRAGMTVLNAVVIAGDYTYRADEDDIVIKRTVDGQDAEIEVTPDTLILPGDIIDVGMRFF